MLLQARRKAVKLWQLKGHPQFRRGLRKGVAASIEHRHVVERENFQTLIDAGANRGQFSLLVGALKPGCRIHAFEPLDDAADAFATATSELPDVTLHRMALGQASETLSINIAAKNDSSSLLEFGRVADLFPEARQVASRQVPVRRLDAVLRFDDLRGTVLMKIDVQGFEWQVIAGATALLPHIDLIYVEVSFIDLYKDQVRFPELNRYLESLGYEAARIGAASGGRGEPGCYADILYRRVRTV